MRGRAMNGWIFLTKEAVKTDSDFNFWINLALDFNKTNYGNKTDKSR
jgi:hypothetical protein